MIDPLAKLSQVAAQLGQGKVPDPLPEDAGTAEIQAVNMSFNRMVQELEGNEGQKHLEEYADSRTERGKCLLHEICAQFGFDSLSYQSLDGLLEAIGLDRDKVCTYCWTGKE